MNPINNVGGNNPIHQITSKPVQQQVPAEAPAARPSAQDRVELSGMGNILKALKSNDVRMDKVTSIKAQIEAGTYETEEKLDVAADRLLDELNR
jgi:anti-sigma28 factor (negative regulator of flagellin synthesis)